jgi:hypothetical protein
MCDGAVPSIPCGALVLATLCGCTLKTVVIVVAERVKESKLFLPSCAGISTAQRGRFHPHDGNRTCRTLEEDSGMNQAVRREGVEVGGLDCLFGFLRGSVRCVPPTHIVTPGFFLTIR